MSWHNGQIISEQEIDKLTRFCGARPLPSSFQIGQRVALHIVMPNKTYRTIGAVVVEVAFSQLTGVQYHLAMSVGPGLYVKSGPYRGFITQHGEAPDPEGGLVSAEDVVVQFPPRQE